MAMRADRVRLVIFDWAGTTIDFGSCAPVEAFVQTFAARAIAVTTAEARVPMGLHKKDHLRQMLQMPAIASRWQATHGTPWTEADLEAMYHDLAPRQLATIPAHSRLVPGLLDVVEQLRRQGLKIGGTTGYFRAAAELAADLAREQGYVPDANVHGDEVAAGRPWPWMVYRVMERLGVCPAASVVKVGDTAADLEEGNNAGVWSLGVMGSSSAIGLPVEEYRALPEAERKRCLKSVAEQFIDAGADMVIESLAELPGAIDTINGALARGKRP